MKSNLTMYNNLNFMKIRVIVSLALVSFSISVFSQTQKQPVKTEAKPSVKTETKQTTAQTDPKKQAVSPFTEHFYKKYVTAVQWNDYEVAKDALYDLIIENPQNDSLISSLAFYYYENQKYVSAVLVSQQLLARNPKNTAALEISAVGYETMGVADRSLQSYESLYLLTNNIATLYKMAFLQYDLKKFTESIASTDILLSKTELDSAKVVFNDVENKPKEYPMKVSVLNLKGLIQLEHFGDKVAAKKIFEDALAISPDFVPAKQNLVKLK
jgi:tetratricopeptide (TPR) repeat protein